MRDGIPALPTIGARSRLRACAIGNREQSLARATFLSPQALLARLDHALNVLTSGPRDTPERQQTLRATIDWSHSLLTESEQRPFRDMAVFVGGCTVTDLEAVCADPGGSILDELESLVDKALVQADSLGDRLRMLQTIGERCRDTDSCAETCPPVCGARPGDPRRS